MGYYRIGWEAWGDLVEQGIIRPMYSAGPENCDIEGSVIFFGGGIKIYPGVRISGQITLGPECVIKDNVVIEGEGYIGVGSTISHNIENPRIGRYCIIDGKVIDSTISEGCLIGEFAEIKRSFLAYGVTAKHSCGVRDAEVGYLTNISEYAQMANYDGVEKRKTRIGSKCMIGVQARIIGGAEIGDEAFIADGARVDKDIPPRAFYNPEKSLKYPQFGPMRDNCAWYLEGNYMALERAIGPEERNYFLKRLYAKFDGQSAHIAKWLNTPIEREAGRTPIECLKRDGHTAVYRILGEYVNKICGHELTTRRDISRENKKLLEESLRKYTANPYDWLQTPFSTGVFVNATPLKVLQMEGECMIPLLIKWAKGKASI